MTQRIISPPILLSQQGLLPNAPARAVAIHPVHPWVVFSVEEDGIMVWNWEKHRVVLETSIFKEESLLFELVEQQKVAQRDEAWKGPKINPNVASQPRKKRHVITSMHFLDEHVIHWWWRDMVSESTELKMPAKDAHWIVVLAETCCAFLNYSTREFRMIPSKTIGGKLTCVEFFPGSSLIAFGCDNGTIAMWDCTRWELMRCQLEHPRKSGITSLAMYQLEEKLRLISCSMDGSVCLWDPVDPGKLLGLEDHAHDGVVWSCIVDRRHPEMVKMGTCGADRTIKMWNWTKADPPEQEQLPPLGNQIGLLNVVERGSNKVGASFFQHPQWAGMRILATLFNKKDTTLHLLPTEVDVGESVCWIELKELIPKAKVLEMKSCPSQPGIVVLGTSTGVVVLGSGPWHERVTTPLALAPSPPTDTITPSPVLPQVFRITPNMHLEQMTFAKSNESPMKRVLPQRLDEGWGPRILDMTAKGAYMSVTNPMSKEYSLWDSTENKKVGSGKGEQVVWSHSGNHHFAILADNKVTLKQWVEGKEVVIAQVELDRTPCVLLGGPLLGIGLMADASSESDLGRAQRPSLVKWVHWEDGSLVKAPAFLIPSGGVQWDTSGSLVALLYRHQTVIAVCTPQGLHDVGTPLMHGAASAVWFNRSLFVDTGRTILCVWPLLTPPFEMEEQILASSELKHGDKHAVARPSGALRLAFVVGTSLMAVDAGGLPRELLLTSPGVCARLLAQGGQMKAAAQWASKVQDTTGRLARFLVMRGGGEEAQVLLPQLDPWWQVHLHLSLQHFEDALHAADLYAGMESAVCGEDEIVLEAAKSKHGRLPVDAEAQRVVLWSIPSACVRSSMKVALYLLCVREAMANNASALSFLGRAAYWDASVYPLLCVQLLQQQRMNTLEQMVLLAEDKDRGRIAASFVLKARGGEDDMVQALVGAQRHAEAAMVARHVSPSQAKLALHEKAPDDEQTAHRQYLQKIVKEWNTALSERYGLLPTLTMNSTEWVKGKTARRRVGSGVLPSITLNLPRGSRIARKGLRSHRTGGAWMGRSIPALAAPPPPRSKEAPA